MLPRPNAAKTAKSAILKIDGEMGEAAARRFIELPRVFAGPSAIRGRHGPPWPPLTLFLIVTMLILTKPRRNAVSEVA
jgi:hypothetical protein